MGQLSLIDYLNMGYRWFIGTKLILAKPAESNGQAGYNVVYNADDERFNTYQSWSPVGPFEDAYHLATGLTFGLALDALKLGKKVARRGWNGKGMWLGLIRANMWGMGSEAPFDWCEEGNDLLPWIGMRTADSHFVPWLASQTDMLSEDWEIVE